MNNIAIITPEQIWERYKDIEKTIELFNNMSGKTIKFRVDFALQRLWQALQIRYHQIS